MTGWAVFWIGCLLFYAIDTTILLKGFNTFFWSYKTPNELEAQRKRVGINAAAMRRRTYKGELN